MNTSIPAAGSRLEILHQLFAAATHDASAAMCRWTSGLISLSLDEVCEIPLEEVCAQLDLGDELLTMIVLSLGGELGGEMILTFDDENGRRLAASLLGREFDPDGGWSELDQSALQETGNILSCAYLNALSRLVDRDLTPSPPQFLQDYGASVLEQALLTQAAACDRILICRTRFEREGQQLRWNVFFVPAPALRAAMETDLSAD